MAWRNLLTGSTTHAWSVSGIASDGKSYTVSLSTAAGPTEVFSMTGNSYPSGDVTGAIGISGLALNTSVSRSYYDAVTFQVLGTRTTINAEPATCSIATAIAAPPTAANVGQSGALNTFNDYNGCTSSAAKTGTSVTTWSLEADGGFTFLCLNTTTKDNANTVTSTESDCVEANTDGSLGTHARVSVASNITLVAKNY
jgi:hypothetical protein